MEIAGYEIENGGLVLVVYVVLMILMLFVFKYWNSKGMNITWGFRIICFVVAAPVTYFIINHFAHKG